MTLVNPCQHLSGPEYSEYILRTETRLLGGISYDLWARIAWQLFPYKPFPPLKDCAVAIGEQIPVCKTEKPTWETNESIKEADWTADEQKKLDMNLLAWAWWEVDYANRVVKSTHCKGTMTNKSGVCEACEKLASDSALCHAVWRVSVCTLWIVWRLTKSCRKCGNLSYQPRTSMSITSHGRSMPPRLYCIRMLTC